MGRKLFEKAGLIQAPPAKAKTEVELQPATEHDDQDSGQTQPRPTLKPKTAPGALMTFMANQTGTHLENESLREKVALFDGALPTRLLDPHCIKNSAWANRHESSFQNARFADLKAEIEQSGGNVQPIKVRPIQTKGGGGLYGTTPPADVTFEIVFGHRRHRACLELGLPVLCLIENLSELALFEQMDRENRQREDLSVWEQGVMYRRALDQGLYPSNRKLAAAIGLDLGNVGKALAVAGLPKEVVSAFAEPTDIQFRYAKPLNDAQQKDPDGLLRRARLLQGRKLSPSQTLNRLLVDEATAEMPTPAPSGTDIVRGKLIAATVRFAPSGAATIKIKSSLDSTAQTKLIAWLDSFL